MSIYYILDWVVYKLEAFGDCHTLHCFAHAHVARLQSEEPCWDPCGLAGWSGSSTDLKRPFLPTLQPMAQFSRCLPFCPLNTQAQDGADCRSRCLAQQCPFYWEGRKMNHIALVSRDYVVNCCFLFLRWLKGGIVDLWVETLFADYYGYLSCLLILKTPVNAVQGARARLIRKRFTRHCPES